MPHLNFPFLVKVGGADYLKPVSAGGEIEGTAPLDLRYGTKTNVRLSHEIKASDYDGAAGDAVAWVSIPRLSNGADTAIYQYTGKKDLAASEQTAVAVWRDYIAVWDTLDGTDRTGNGHDLSVVSAPAAGSLIGSAGDFANDRMEIDAAFLNGLTSWTMSFWIKADAIDTDAAVYVISDAPASRDNARNYFRFDKRAFLQGNTGNCFKFGHNGAEWESPLNLQSTDATYIAIAKAAGSAPTLYVNGDPVAWAATHDPTNGNALTSPWSIPAGYKFMVGPSWEEAGFGDGEAPWNGLIDELRITAKTRSAGWIKTEFFNQSDPAGFFSVSGDGAEPLSGTYDGVTGEDVVVIPPPPPPDPTPIQNSTDAWFQETDGLAGPPAAPTHQEPVSVGNRPDLHNAMVAAFDGSGRTVIRLTSSITLSSDWITTYNFNGKGGQVVIDFNGHQIQCKNGSSYYRLQWVLADSYAFNKNVNTVSTLSHTAGTAPNGKTTATFNTLPANCNVGDWIKLGCFARTRSTAEADGSYPHARTPDSHRHGEEVQIEEIIGNALTFGTKLYFSDRWDNITAPIYGGKIKNKFESLWLVQPKVVNNKGNTFRFERLNAPRVIKPWLTWKTGLGSSVDFSDFMLFIGCVEWRVFDPYIDRPDELAVISTKAYGIRGNAMKRGNVVRTRNSNLAYNAARLRHFTDCGDSKPNSNNDQTDLMRAGQTHEFGVTDCKTGDMGSGNDNNPFAMHQNANACRWRGALQNLGTNTTDYLIAMRGVNHIVENMDMVTNPTNTPYNAIFQGFNEASESLFEFGSTGQGDSPWFGTSNSLFDIHFRNNLFVVPSGKSLFSIDDGWYGPFQHDNNTIHHYGSSIPLDFSPGVAYGDHTGEVYPSGKLAGYTASGREDGGLIIMPGSTCRQAARVKNGAEIVFDHYRIDLQHVTSGTFTVCSVEGAADGAPASAASGTVVINNPNNIQIVKGSSAINVIDENATVPLDTTPQWSQQARDFLFDNANPVLPTPTEPEDILTANDLGELETHLNTACAAVGKVTEVKLGQDITGGETGWRKTFTIQDGATVIYNGNNFWLDGNGNELCPVFKGTMGDSVNVLGVEYEFGTASWGDNAIVEFDALPTGTVAGPYPTGSIIKIYVPHTSDTYDPTLGCEYWARKSNKRKIGIAFRVLEIEHLANSVKCKTDGIFYDDPAENYFDQVAKKGLMKARRYEVRPDSLYLVDYWQRDGTDQRALWLWTLERSHLLRPRIESSHDGDFLPKIQPDNCFETKLYNPSYTSPADLPQLKQIVISSLFCGRRTVAVVNEDGPAGGQPVNAECCRDFIDGASGSWGYNTGQSDYYYAERAGSDYETGHKDLTAGRKIGSGFSGHEATVAMWAHSFEFTTEVKSAGVTSWVFVRCAQGRGHMSIIENYESRADYTPANVNMFGGSNASAGWGGRNVSGWDSIYRDGTAIINVTGRRITANTPNQACIGPYHTIRREFQITATPEINNHTYSTFHNAKEPMLWNCDAGEDIINSQHVYRPDLLPNRLRWTSTEDLVRVMANMNLTIFTGARHGEMTVKDMTVDLAGMTSGRITIAHFVAGSGWTSEISGNVLVLNKHPNVTVRPTYGDGNMSGLHITLG